MAVHVSPVDGAPCWVSLTTGAVESAERFYAKVASWTFGPGRLGQGFSVAYDSSGMPVAGLGPTGESVGPADEWNPYFAVCDLDRVTHRVTERVGTVAVGPVPLGHGRAASAADPQGARFGLWQGDVLETWQAAGSGLPGRLDLRTRDAFAAAIFYGEVLQWDRDDSACDVAYAHDRVEVSACGGVAATLAGGGEGSAEAPHTRPRWEVTFNVPDLEAALATAESLGGTVLEGPRSDSPEQRALLTDPDGAHFALQATTRPD